jgi:PAS domain S-box-containing protein
MNDITERKRLENSLMEQLLFLQTLIDTIPNPIFFKDIKGNYLGCNKAFEDYHGVTRDSLIGKSVYDMEPKDEADKHHQADMKLLRKSGSITYDYLFHYPDGTMRDVINSKATFMKPDGTVGGIVGVIIDITDRKRAEEELKNHRDHLEQTVEARTAELQSSKGELEIKTRTLEEVNIALKVLLRQIEEDKKDLEERFTQNIKQLVLPYVEKIKKSRLDALQYSSLSIIETNLNEIVSPFLHSLQQFNFTPRETQIASLIKDGKTTKEIADTIGVAPSAVDTYRNKIRHKLDLNNKKINLQSYLQSLK